MLVKEVKVTKKGSKKQCRIHSITDARRGRVDEQASSRQLKRLADAFLNARHTHAARTQGGIHHSYTDDIFFLSNIFERVTRIV